MISLYSAVVFCGDEMTRELCVPFHCSYYRVFGWWFEVGGGCSRMQIPKSKLATESW